MPTVIPAMISGMRKDWMLYLGSQCRIGRKRMRAALNHLSVIELLRNFNLCLTLVCGRVNGW